MKQSTFSLLSFDAKKKRARREVSLGGMERVVPRAALEGLVEPQYPGGRRGRPPTVLRIHLSTSGSRSPLKEAAIPDKRRSGSSAVSRPGRLFGLR